MFEHIGVENSASTTIIRQARSGACSATIATSWLGMRRRQRCCSGPLSTFAVGSDVVASISPIGQEDVFDVQVDRTENFIANGLVSHNTRWHQDDLAGRLLDLAAKNPEADQWEVIEFPAILEDETQRQEGDPRKLDEALWEEQHPLTEMKVERIQAGPIKWSAVFQQRPSPAKGVIFSVDNFKYFHTEYTSEGLVLILAAPGRNLDPDNPPVRYLASECRWFQTCDPADTNTATSAFTAVVTFVRTPGNHLLIFHVWRQRLEFPKRYAAIQGLRIGLGKWDDEHKVWILPGSLNPWPRALLYQAMEAKASGIGMIQTAAAEGRPFRPLKPGTSGKVERCAQVSVLYNNGSVYHHAAQPWLTSLEAELLQFPSGKYADQVDCIAYAGILFAQDNLLGNDATSQEVFSEEKAIGPGKFVWLDQHGSEILHVGGHDVLFEDESGPWYF